MKQTYFLGLDAAKHKIRAALSAGQEAYALFNKHLPVTAGGLDEIAWPVHLPARESLRSWHIAWLDRSTNCTSA